jgi:hypothetical protein
VLGEKVAHFHLGGAAAPRMRTPQASYKVARLLAFA